MKQTRIAASLLALGLIAPGAAQSQTSYTIRPVLKVGEVAGDLAIPKEHELRVNGLSDRGHVVLVSFNPAGPLKTNLFQYVDGTFTTIAVPGGVGPIGTWPADFWASWDSANLRGTSLFNAYGDDRWLGLFRWEATSSKLTRVLEPGMRVGERWTFDSAGALSQPPEVNNHDELALVPELRDSSGKLVRGIFFLGRDGQWQPVLLPGQELPGGGTSVGQHFYRYRCNDSGVVAFLARRQSETQFSAFLWERGTLRTMLSVGQDAPGGGKFTSIGAVGLSNLNREVVVAAAVDNRRDYGIYRVVEGQVIPVALPGQAMSGGGTFKSVRYAEEIEGPGSPTVVGGIGASNQKGRFPIMATLSNLTSALYILEADGRVTPVLRQGQVTELGRVTALEWGAATLNNNGEMTVGLWINSGRQLIAILRPTPPQ